MTPAHPDQPGTGSLLLPKARVLATLFEVLSRRMEQVERELAQLDEAQAGETKSSAGDKYETAREMVAQSRQMQLRIQQETRAGLEWLRRQDPPVSSSSFSTGALVRTEDGWFLVCPCPVELDVDGTRVQGISLSSPVGQVCKGAHAGDTRLFRDRTIEILAIL